MFGWEGTLNGFCSCIRLHSLTRPFNAETTDGRWFSIGSPIPHEGFPFSFLMIMGHLFKIHYFEHNALIVKYDYLL